MSSQQYGFYNRFGSGYFYQFLRNNTEFDTAEFRDHVIRLNKGDRDSGELSDIAKHEVLRLAYEYEELRWRSGLLI